MLILIPPSEGKHEGGDGAPLRKAAPKTVQDVQPVLARLEKLRPEEYAAWYKATGEAKLAAIHEANGNALHTPTMPAIARYAGVVYDHIDFASLRQKAAARKRLLIVSGMFGVVPGGAPLPWYKLPGNTWLARHWRPINSARLHALANGRPVLNLLSQTYAKMLDYEPLVTVDFRVAGGKKAAGHFGKAVKGKFVRYVIESKITSVDDFDGFEEDGYRWNGTDFVREE